MHILLLVLGALSIPLYLWERHAYQEERGKFYMALQSADAGWWFWDLRSNKVEWGRQMFSLFEMEGESPLTLDQFYSAIHEEDRGRVRAAIEWAVATRNGYQDIFRINTPSGVKEIRAAGAVSADGRYMTGINLPAIQRILTIPQAPLSPSLPVPGERGSTRGIAPRPDDPDRPALPRAAYAVDG